MRNGLVVAAVLCAAILGYVANQPASVARATSSTFTSGFPVSQLAVERSFSVPIDGNSLPTGPSLTRMFYGGSQRYLEMQVPFSIGIAFTNLSGGRLYVDGVLVGPINGLATGTMPLFVRPGAAVRIEYAIPTIPSNIPLYLAGYTIPAQELTLP